MTVYEGPLLAAFIDGYTLGVKAGASNEAERCECGHMFGTHSDAGGRGCWSGDCGCSSTVNELRIAAAKAAAAKLMTLGETA